MSKRQARTGGKLAEIGAEHVKIYGDILWLMFFHVEVQFQKCRPQSINILTADSFSWSDLPFVAPPSSIHSSFSFGFGNPQLPGINLGTTHAKLQYLQR